MALLIAAVALAVSTSAAHFTGGWSHADDVAYVDALYADLLHRNAGAPELGPFVAALDAGTPRADVASKILASMEARHLQTDILYVHYLRRAASPFDAGGSASLQQTAIGILSSPEYYRLNGGKPDSFAKALYRDVLGRPPTPNDEVLIAFERGDVQRPYVVGAVFNSTEAIRRLADSYCQLYLHRPCGPHAPSGATSLDAILVAILSSTAYGDLHRASTFNVPPMVHFVTPTPSPIPPPR